MISHAPLMAVEAEGEPVRLIGHLAAMNPHAHCSPTTRW
jgi:predicted FMN-binding regulatory protein PaiB